MRGLLSLLNPMRLFRERADAAQPSKPLPASALLQPMPLSDLVHWANGTVEKIRTATAAGRMRFLPWLDHLTEETPEIKRHYRIMLREPTLKAALLTKVLSVAAQDVQVHPEDEEDQRQVEVGEAVLTAFTKIRGGTRKVAWNVLAHGLIDGWSLNEIVMHDQPERSGPLQGKLAWKAFKSKDTRFLNLLTDSYHNVVGVRAGPYNAGHVFEGADLESFLIYTHLEFFEHPYGMSDFRAPYRAYFIKDTTWKLRGLHLDKFTSPFLKGTYSSIDQKAALEAALEAAKASTWLTVPIGVMVEAVEFSQRGTADYESAIKDCDREMLIGTVGSYLQILEGQVSEGRGDTSVHKEMGELLQWMLSATLGDVVSEQMVAPWVRLNYADVPLPTVTWGAINEAALKARAAIDESLQAIGLELSRKEAYRYYGRQRPTDAADVLRPGTYPTAGIDPMQQPAMPGGQPPANGAVPAVPAVQAVPAVPEPNALFGDFVEAEHPRKGGKFTDKPGGPDESDSSGPPAKQAPAGRPQAASAAAPQGPDKWFADAKTGADVLFKAVTAAEGLKDAATPANYALHALFPQAERWKGTYEDEDHEWARIDGKFVDVTASQFGGGPKIMIDAELPEEYEGEQVAWEPESKPDQDRTGKILSEVRASLFPASAGAAAPVTVVASKGSSKGGVHELLDTELTDEQYAAIACAPPGATVKVSIDESGVQLTCKRHGVSTDRTISKDDDGNLIAHNGSFEIAADSPYKGQGHALFARQVATYRQLGIKQINTLAAGFAGDEYNGYYTWPRMGYNAPLKPSEVEAMPPEVHASLNAQAATVLDLMQTPQGREWWKQNGTGRTMTFDLKPDSRSIQTLQAYSTERGQRGK